MSRALKRVLIEEAELDRLQQRQLRDYSPELHSMAALHRQTMDVLLRKDLDEGAKLKMLGTIDSRFNQLKRETNTLGSKPILKQCDPDAQDKDIEEPPIAQAEVDAEPEIEAEAKEEVEQNSPLDLRIKKLHPLVRAKAAKLLQTITTNPNVLARNEAGELMLNGEAVHGSNFDKIFSAAFTANKIPDLAGTDSFFKGLRILHVGKSALSSRHFVRALATTPPHAGPLRHGAFALDWAEEPVAKRGRETPTLRKTKEQPVRDDYVTPMSPPIRHRSKQTGKGRRAPPPGRRAKVLFVY